MKLFGNRRPEHAIDALIPIMPMQLAGKYLVFELAGELYGILLQKVQEIVLVENIVSVGAMPSYALGTLDLRGASLPVIDLRRRLHVREKKVDHRSSVVIAQVTPAGGRPLAAGFLIDAIEDVLTLPPHAILETPYTLADGRPGEFAGIARLGEGKNRKTITLVNPDSLLTRRDLSLLLR